MVLRKRFTGKEVKSNPYLKDTDRIANGSQSSGPVAKDQRATTINTLRMEARSKPGVGNILDMIAKTQGISYKARSHALPKHKNTGASKGTTRKSIELYRTLKGLH